jgi:hypothetical protein
VILGRWSAGRSSVCPLPGYTTLWRRFESIAAAVGCRPARVIEGIVRRRAWKCVGQLGAFEFSEFPRVRSEISRRSLGDASWAVRAEAKVDPRPAGSPAAPVLKAGPEIPTATNA